MFNITRFFKRNESFIEKSVKHMNENGVNVHFIASEYYEGCAGMYQHPDMWVATKREKWIEVFVHEYCHFLQMLDENEKNKYPGYPSISESEYEDWSNIFDPSSKLTSQQVTTLRRKIQLMERNCDVRAHELILKNKLDIDAVEYVKRSNCYHLFYTLIEKHKKWYKTPPYEIKELVDMMPTAWLLSYERLPLGFEEIVVSKCFQNDL